MRPLTWEIHVGPYSAARHRHELPCFSCYNSCVDRLYIDFRFSGWCTLYKGPQKRARLPTSAIVSAQTTTACETIETTGSGLVAEPPEVPSQNNGDTALGCREQESMPTKLVEQLSRLKVDLKVIAILNIHFWGSNYRWLIATRHPTEAILQRKVARAPQREIASCISVFEQCPWKCNPLPLLLWFFVPLAVSNHFYIMLSKLDPERPFYEIYVRLFWKGVLWIRAL